MARWRETLVAALAVAPLVALAVVVVVAVPVVLFMPGCEEGVKVMGPNTVRANHVEDVDDAIARCDAVLDIRKVGSDTIVICQGAARP